MSSLGKRLKQARENKNITQMYIAKKLGISNGTLSGYERDYRDPDTEILSKLAGIYEVSVDWLTGITDDSSPKRDTNDFTPDAEEIEKFKKILASLPRNKHKYFLEHISILAAGIIAMEKEHKGDK
ncbi:helix-turn-helix domain-containing protein [Brevibacillus laterosporus]|uniref:helix-turn-helix domain-containing protein n=1 Tax=Brevibacillus laterosporus TaxID=1465 RepID=UPI0018CCAE34|nr:helix-turn-helix domain-containing protein [Brevibacillus laterosporus]MBG9786587.1 hypothetical protein [Brevibacillus laterosporus]